MSRVVALVVSAAAAAGVWFVWRLAVDTTTGQLVEAAALAGASYGQTRLWRLAEPVLDVVSLSFIAIGAGVAVVIALVRRRFALAVQAVVLLVGANLVTQLLKRVLDRPELGGDVSPNSLPSGHTTVAASLAAALLLVAPRRARPWIAILGAGYTAATGVSTLIGQWHRPSDAVAAVLVVLSVAAFLCAVGPPSTTDLAAPVRGSRTPPAPSPPKPDALTTALLPGAPVGMGSPGTAARPSTRAAQGAPGAPAPLVRERADTSPGTAPAAAVLLAGAVLAGIPAVWGLREAYLAVVDAEPLRDVATYVAGAFAVVSASLLVFVLLLLVRQSTARPPDE